MIFSILKIIFCFVVLACSALTTFPLIGFGDSFIYQYSLLYIACFVLSNVFYNNYAFAAVLIYILAGLCGLPIFAFGAGLGYIQEPSFGYLLGLIPLSIIAFYFRYYVDNFPILTLQNKSLGPLLGIFAAHACGIFYLLCKGDLNLENLISGSGYQLFYDFVLGWIAILIIPAWRSPVQVEEIRIHKSFRGDLG